LGDDAYGGSSDSLTQRVTGTTVEALTSSANPATYGDTVTFTATVSSPAGGTPTGTVTFTDDDGTTLGTASLSVVNGQNQATLSPSSWAARRHVITADYGGDDTYWGTSTSLSQLVKATTVEALTSSANPSAYGQTVTFTATLTAADGGTPTGRVTFTNG